MLLFFFLKDMYHMLIAYCMLVLNVVTHPKIYIYIYINAIIVQCIVQHKITKFFMFKVKMHLLTDGLLFFLYSFFFSFFLRKPCILLLLK